MSTCAWCGTENSSGIQFCDGCGAPTSVKVDTVFVDLSGLKGKVEFKVRRLPAAVSALLPGVNFQIKVEGTTITLTPKETNKANFSGVVAIGNNNMAVGAGAVMIGGNVRGTTIVTGNRVKHPGNGEPKRLNLWLPLGLQTVIVSGNGKTTLDYSYPVKPETVDTTVISLCTEHYE